MGKFMIMLLFLIITELMILVEPPQIVKDVKDGTKTLECEFSDGWRVIPPEKILYLDDVTGRWIFTNGSAGTCEVY